MSHVLGDAAYHNEESKKEFQSAKDKPGIHIYNPKTPVELHLPGGIQKFNDVFMECTFRKDMKTVVYEWWWSKTMDFPLFEVTSEQYRENKLQYYIEDYNTKSKDVGNSDFYYVIGQETRTKFYYDVKDRYLVVRIDGRYSLFELLERYPDASPYDRFYIKGGLDIKTIRIPYEDPLPVPLSLPLTSAGILKGDLYEIKGKNPRNAEEFRLVFGDQSLQVPLGAEHEDFVLEVKGEEDGLCTAELNGVELPGVISKGPFLADRMVLEGDVDFHWVIITKPGGPEAAIEESKEKDPAEEETKEKDEDSKA
ncbi:uncharacterized protein LOC142585819 isoform X1 [Dermacentor variabilis]|uniref:uncharacterized protein LOC142585819 isoform X1 n=1 Tax=Dermacentor variabilis TaxID=34621 RepID=UPI003F5B64C6